jgi:uncharacterized membrane protein
MNMKLKKLVALLILFIAPSAFADERILKFDVEIRIQQDGSVDVQEDILVNAEGQEIKRGIYRDIPTELFTKYRFRESFPITVREVLRDGERDSYALEDISTGSWGTAGQRIRIGRKEHFLDSGQHQYRIRYSMPRQIRAQEEKDELYWNVTGNYWSFPIESASVRVFLPTTIPSSTIQSWVYTGQVGEKGQDAKVSIRGSEVFAQTTRPFVVGEGLTLSVTFPAGTVTRETQSEHFRRLLESNTSDLLIWAGTILLGLYFYFAWVKVGRDAPAGTIIPRFQPPQDLGPADVRYLRAMGFDQKTFTAFLIDLASRGFLQINDEKGKFQILRKHDKKPSETEETILKALFGSSNEVTIVRVSSSLAAKMTATKNALQKSLKAKFEGKSFHKNSAVWWKGFGIFFIVLIGSILTIHGDQKWGVIFLSFWLTIWSAGCIALGLGVVTAWRTGSFLTAIGLSIFALPFFGGEGAALFFLLGLTSVPFIVAVVGNGVLLWIFGRLLQASTPLGQKQLDEIEGFRMYLKTAEEDTLQNMVLPQKTPELYEKYLPFALALDVEQEWSEKFSNVLANIGEENSQHGYHPNWYRGNNFTSATAFSTAIASTFASAVASVSSPSSSSSGSSGGGSSGGGGGGGGGGGW